MAFNQSWGGTKRTTQETVEHGLGQWFARQEVMAQSAVSGARGFGQDIWGGMGKTGVGRAAQQGLAMDFGFYRQETLSGGRAGPMPRNAPFQFMGGAFQGVRGSGGMAAGAAQLQKNLGAKTAAGAAGKLGLKALPLVGNLAFMYMGYREGGIGGAIDAGLESAKFSIAWEVGAAVLGSAALPLAIGAGIAGGAGYGYYQFGEAAQRHGRKMRKLEMGGEVTDRFGTMSTMRQRSLQALNNTHVNGRMALGNEAAIMHTPMW